MDGILATLRADEFLNVRFGATPEEVRKAYVALMRVYHPDKNPKYGPRANWICQLLSEARDRTDARSLERRFPVLEHYKPVIGGEPDLCKCGFVKDGLSEICTSCGTIFLPQDDTQENKDRVWALCKTFALNLKAQVGGRFDDYEAAGRLYRRHFDGGR